MKKAVIFLLLLSFLIVLPACGDKDDVPDDAEVEATELPTVTAPPEGEVDEEWILRAEARPKVGEPGYVEPDSEEYRTAIEMIGRDLKDLTDKIGEPKTSSYATSCIAPGSGAEDGLLYYEDFTVSTVRYPSGKETVTGAF